MCKDKRYQGIDWAGKGKEFTVVTLTPEQKKYWGALQAENERLRDNIQEALNDLLDYPQKDGRRGAIAILQKALREKEPARLRRSGGK